MSNKNIEKKSLMTKQLFLFQLLDQQAINYSNFVHFYDNIPKFVDLGRRRYFSYDEVKPKLSTKFSFNNDEYIVTLKPAQIEHEGKSVLVYPSVQRDQAIYDALRKIATTTDGAVFGELDQTSKRFIERVPRNLG